MLNTYSKKALLCGIAFICLLVNNSLQAQNAAQVISAEKSFAKYAADHNTQEAFVKFLSDSSIVFSKGDALNGRDTWKPKKPNAALLSWYPSFAAIASSGEIACTSGPWEFRSKRTDTNAAAFGHFATIWEKQPNGEWLVKLDIGIQHEKQAEKEPEATPYSDIASGQTKPDAGLLAIETNFTTEENAKGITIFKNYLTDKARVYRPDELPELSLKNTKNPPGNSDLKYTYTVINTAVSRSGDFGYAYGKAAFMQGNKASNGNYFRVWKRENGKWKIILDLIAV